jgi:hypothetical protein
LPPVIQINTVLILFSLPIILKDMPQRLCLRYEFVICLGKEFKFPSLFLKGILFESCIKAP